MFWGIALKASILPEFASFWELPIRFISQFLIMAFAFDGWAEALDFARPFVGEQVVFDGVAFLLARVISLLTDCILRPTDGALSAINDKFQSRTALQHRFDVFGRAF